jgi:hypothetical protein
VNDGCHKSVRANSSLKLLNVHYSIFLHWQVRHSKTFVFELAAGVEHALVLNLGRNYMALFLAVETSGALKSQVVGFSGT